MRRIPPRRRDCWTIRWIADPMVSRMAREGRSWPAWRTSVSRRTRASFGLLAWSVDIDPSWPVFMAWSMSRASPPRHSPTMMRSGRIRRQLLTSSRIGTAPLPSTLGGRDSSWIQCGCCSWSSAASSHVISRSFPGMNVERMLRRVVLPEPVPPETRMLRRARTHDRRKAMIPGLAGLLHVALLWMVGHDFGDVRVGEQRLERSKAQHVVEDRIDKALLVVLGHRHRRGSEVLLGELEDLFADAGLVAGVDLVRELLDQLGVDLHLGRGERRRELAAGGGAALTERRSRGTRRRLGDRDRSLRRVWGGARKGRGGGTVAYRSRRRNRLVLLDPI